MYIARVFISIWIYSRTAAHFPLRHARTWRFQPPYHKLSFPEQQYSIFASLWCVYRTCMQELAPLMNVLLWKRRDFFVKLLGQRYARVRLKPSPRNLYRRYRDLIRHYEVPLSEMLHEILGNDYVQCRPPFHFIKSLPCYRTGPYYRFWRYYLIPGGFHRTFATDAASHRGHLLFRTPGFVPFGTCICSNETIHSWTCNVYGPFLYHKLRKTFGKFVMSYYELLSKFGEISFQEYVSEGISHSSSSVM